jgi:hypothetical protein
MYSLKVNLACSERRNSQPCRGPTTNPLLSQSVCWTGHHIHYASSGSFISWPSKTLFGCVDMPCSQSSFCFPMGPRCYTFGFWHMSASCTFWTAIFGGAACINEKCSMLRFVNPGMDWLRAGSFITERQIWAPYARSIGALAQKYEVGNLAGLTIRD